jgi:hypothetical protein
MSQTLIASYNKYNNNISTDSEIHLHLLPSSVTETTIIISVTETTDRDSHQARGAQHRDGSMNTGALAACVAAARGVCTFWPTLAPLLRRIGVGPVIGFFSRWRVRARNPSLGAALAEGADGESRYPNVAL